MPQDAEVRAPVDHLLERLRSRSSVPDFEGFVLREVPPPPPVELGWLGRLLIGPLPAPPAARVTCEDVSRHQDQPFERHDLFWARVHGTRLDRPVPPAGSSLGLFAHGPQGYRYVSRRRGEVEAMLDADARPLDDYDPVSLGRVLIDALASRGPHTHALLDDPARLVDDYVARGYRLDEGEARRWLPRLTAPRITGHEPGGWTLELHTLYGWMHDKRMLCRLRYGIRCTACSYRHHAAHFHIEEHVEPLSKRLFREVPMGRH